MMAGIAVRWAVFCCLAMSVAAPFVVGQQSSAAANAPEPKPAPRRPHIVLVLADDMGLGEVQAIGGKSSQIPTPHLDRLVREGLSFRDAHAPSGVCSPTRYGLLTGRYAWRTALQESVLFGYDPPLIAAGRKTLGGLLQGHGYHTACIGKWHLGWNWMKAQDQPIRDPSEALLIDWTLPTPDGPLTHGFDEFFGLHGTLDMSPFTFVEGALATAPCTEIKRFGRRGPAAAAFEAEDVLDQLLARSVRFLEERAEQREQPFFLFASLTSPHTPIVPAKRYQGRSELGPYGDFIVQTDAWCGALFATLERLKLADDTLLIFASDNGCSPVVNLPAMRARGHDPIGGYRGAKADLFEGGHRVPFVVRWPGVVKPGQTSDALICLTDLVATCAELVGAELPADLGEDSESMLGLLEGRSGALGRSDVILHSYDGSFAIREGPWKLLLCAGSGGWSEPEPGSPAEARLPAKQLYHLERDRMETQNLAEQEPEIVARLEVRLAEDVRRGRSTPGLEQANDIEVITAPPQQAPRQR